ncbi:MAG: GNAT family N-acetyltransferase [Bacteroidetes bacterium]|nr:GNAT family N-acetyltransferase [Bacteroidota bacterium]
MIWICKKFDELTPRELYAIMQLRNEVFVVEQNCVFQDADNKDQSCYHMMCMQDDKLIAYARIVPAGISYSETSIGRVVTSPSARGTGIGNMLLRKTLDTIISLYGKVPLKIGAQLYLKKFYESFAFKQTSDIYIEDDIQHIEMMLEYNDK